MLALWDLCNGAYRPIPVGTIAISSVADRNFSFGNYRSYLRTQWAVVQYAIIVNSLMAIIGFVAMAYTINIQTEIYNTIYQAIHSRPSYQA
jgi:hypothetical protein